jgi:hypothetical protein
MLIRKFARDTPHLHSDDIPNWEIAHTPSSERTNWRIPWVVTCMVR